MRAILYPILLISLMGCEASTDPGPPSPSQGAIKAEDATGIWNESQVRQYISEELKLSSVNLTATGGGGYQATGQTAEGTQYQITIEQKPGGIRYDWTTADGKHGGGAFGNFVEQ